jgi:hypothetical protein
MGKRATGSGFTGFSVKLPQVADNPCSDGPGPDPDDGRPEAAKLLREMLALGISRWHPDPLAAIEEAKKAAAR